MRRQLLVVMLVMWVGACRPAPEPAPDQSQQTEFFEPESTFEEPKPEEASSLEDTLDFSWWTDEDIVVHPRSKATDDELWLLWEHRTSDEEYQRLTQHPTVIARVYPSGPDTLLTSSGGVDPDFGADMWISFGEPFTHDVRHLFEAPYPGPRDEPRAYETDDFVFVSRGGGNFYIIFDPEAARNATDPTIPTSYVPLFEATQEYLGTFPLEVHLIFPTYQLAETQTLHLWRPDRLQSLILSEKPSVP